MKANRPNTLLLALLAAIVGVIVIGVIADKATAELSQAPYNFCSPIHNADGCVIFGACTATNAGGYVCVGFSTAPGAIFTFFRNYNLPYERCGANNQSAGVCPPGGKSNPVCETQGYRASTTQDCGIAVCTADVTDVTCQSTPPPPLLYGN